MGRAPLKRKKGSRTWDDKERRIYTANKGGETNKQGKQIAGGKKRNSERAQLTYVIVLILEMATATTTT